MPVQSRFRTPLVSGVVVHPDPSALASKQPHVCASQTLPAVQLTSAHSQWPVVHSADALQAWPLPPPQAPRKQIKPTPQLRPSGNVVHVVVDVPGWQLWQASDGSTAPLS
jgi:hypothetical protein